MANKNLFNDFKIILLLNDESFWKPFRRFMENRYMRKRLNEYRSKKDIPSDIVLGYFIEQYKVFMQDERESIEIRRELLSKG